MAMLDVLDALNVSDEQVLNDFEEQLQSEEAAKTTEQSTPTTQPPDDKPKTAPKSSIQSEYKASKPDTPTTKGMVKTGVSQSNQATFSEGESQSTSTSQGTSDNVQYKVEPDISMDDWKKKYQYKDWSEFSKEMGYTPPSAEDLEKKQKLQRQVAWIKGLGGAANELAKMIGVSAGGDALKQEYKIDEVDEYKKDKEDYLKKLEDYKTKGMNYELGLRDKYAQYMQNMAKTVSSGKSTSQTDQAGTTTQRGEVAGTNETWQDAASVKARNAANWASARAKTEQKKVEQYGFGWGTFTINTDQTKDKAVVNRAYQALKNHKALSEEQKKALRTITPQISTDNSDKLDESIDNQYRYVVAATKVLLDDAYRLNDEIQEALKSEDPLQYSKAEGLKNELEKKEQAIQDLQKTGIEFQHYTK